MWENDPEVLARQLAANKGPDAYIAFQVGSKENPATISGVKKFMATYSNSPLHTKYWEIPGGRHNATTCLSNMREPLKWISEQMEGPTPSP
ncbi:hypothetical protein [Streptomyces noursei]|uniref:hypothetical protein n=1 Tax=Streptomyces noursei TaxID=1971 RepID=UPI0015E08B31|nr:hypothetical protein [Streptomyces noursei]